MKFFRQLTIRFVSSFAATAMLLGLFANVSPAALISLDFNVQNTASPFQISPTMSGEEVAGVGTIFTGQTGPWNALLVGNELFGDLLTQPNVITSPLSTSPLVQGDGAPSPAIFTFGVGATVGTPVPYRAFNGVGAGSTNLREDMLILDAGTQGPVAWQISGLIPGETYDLVLFGQRYDNAAFNPALFTVFGNPPTLFDSQNDGNFVGVVANVSGVISGTYAFQVGQNNAAWSGLQISGLFVAPVPEPSTGLLIGLGGIGLAIRVRRRRGTRVL